MQQQKALTGVSVVLYQPRPGNVPKISRSILNETFMALGNGDADDKS